jgi:8-oxo-dGTP pyrophosphatase MutT (NUDIX family)
MKSSFIQSVQDLLNSWQPACDLQQQYKIQFLDVLSEDTCSRSHTNPGHVTASGFVRTEDFGRICLIFHPRFQKWIQPGGHIEVEDVEIISAARREIFEETGLENVHWDGTIRLDVHQVPTTSKQEAHLHFDIQLGFVGEYASLNGDVRGEWVVWESFDKTKSDDSVLRFLEGWR